MAWGLYAGLLARSVGRGAGFRQRLGVTGRGRLGGLATGGPLGGGLRASGLPGAGLPVSRLLSARLRPSSLLNARLSGLFLVADTGFFYNLADYDTRLISFFLYWQSRD